jgi:hypothetical protein
MPVYISSDSIFMKPKLVPKAVLISQSSLFFLTNIDFYVKFLGSAAILCINYAHFNGKY